jgi:hypothetical protein
MSSKAVHNEVPSEVPDSHLPDWLVLSLIVVSGCAGYTLVAYLVWLWTS